MRFIRSLESPASSGLVLGRDAANRQGTASNRNAGLRMKPPGSPTSIHKTGLQSARTALANIFISYRREDSAAYAGRLCDHLEAVFGKARVFMDVEDIAPGQDFAQTIDQTIAKCNAALVIIGPRWM